MERNRCFEQSFLKEYVFEPLQLLVDRMSMLQDEYRYDSVSAQHVGTSIGGSVQRWKNLESRLSAIDTHMTRSTHEDLPQIRRKELTSLIAELLEIIKKGRPQRLEAAKAEADLARKMEDVAGRVLCGPCREEHAARCTSLELLKQAMDRPEKLGQKECEQMTKEIHSLRQQLARQRQARKEEDEHILQLIETKASGMQRALLEVVGDPED